MIKQKAKILFFLKIPPPLTGPTMMNRQILKSRLFRNEFYIDEITFNFARSNRDFGKIAFKKAGTFLSLIGKLVRQIKKNRPDLVYFQLSPFGIAFKRDFIYICILKLFKVKTLFHIRGKGINRLSRQNGILRFMYKTAFKNEFLICFSSPLAKDVENVYEGTPYLVPNGIQTVIDRGDSNKFKERGLTKILYISTYCRNKGILDLFEAISIIKQKGFPISVIVVGSENEFSIADLKNIAISMMIDDMVSIVGAKYDNDKSEELKKADLFVFPTRHEAFGNVVLEAMQFGLPVVASREGSLPEIVVDGETGLLFNPGDSAMLAEKLIVLINNDELRERMGKAGQQRYFNEYTFDHFEKYMLRVFHDVLRNIVPENASR